jgi:8-oxo-dGTP pyrophosphatase MutT (NUDIX family)
VKLGDVRERLQSIPAVLPPPPSELRPMLLAGPGGAPSVLPRSATIREAAALVLLFPDSDGNALVLLTERPTGDLRHSGEISFPGGVIDPTDASIEEAAFREAREEVGLDAAAAGVTVTVLGRLRAVEIPVSGFRVHPVVAIADSRPPLKGDAREVAALLEVPVDTFLPGAPIEMVEAERGGRRLRYGAFAFGEYRVWGATANMLGQLGALLAADAADAADAP